MTGRARLGAAAAAVLLLGALAAPQLAYAHAILTRSDPADGSRLTGSPREIRLWFSEQITPRFHSVRLVAPGGGEVPAVRVRALGPAGLAIEAPRLHKGTYAVVWQVLAEDDGHRTSGTVGFGVGVGAAPRAQARHEPLPSVLDVALRWLRFSCVALLLGCLAFALGVLRAPKAEAGLAERARRRVLAAAVAGSGLAALVGVAALVRQTLDAAALAPESSQLRVLVDLLSGRWGLLWLVGEATVLALGGLALASRRRAVPWPAMLMAVPLAATWAVTEALGSHAAALKGELAVAVGALHVLAAGIWMGGVAALALALWPGGEAGRRDAVSLARVCMKPFARAAGGSAVVVVVTGLYAAGLQVASVDALLTTFYGRVLLAKVALAGAAAAFGAANFLLLARLARGDSQTVRRGILLAEARLGLALFLAAGILSASVPALGREFAAPRPVHAETVVRQAGDLLVSVTIRPNRPGDNVFTAVTASSRRPAPARIASVEARLGEGGTEGRVFLSPVESGRYLGTGRLQSSGASRMVVLVRRGGATLRLPFRWSVEPRDPARAVVVSDRRLSSIVNPAALLLLGAAVAVAIALLLRRLRLPAPRVRTLRGESS